MGCISGRCVEYPAGVEALVKVAGEVVGAACHVPAHGLFGAANDGLDAFSVTSRSKAHGHRFDRAVLVAQQFDDDMASLAHRRFCDLSADALKGVFPWAGEVVVNGSTQEPE